MNAVILFLSLGLVVVVCITCGVYIVIRDWRRARRSAWNSRFVDKRFQPPDPRAWQKQFEQYERPAILRRQAE